MKPECVAEIEFAGWTADGQVRQAAFKGLREDKPAAEVTTEVAASVGPVKPGEAPVQKSASRATGRKGAKVEIMGVLISNPDKVLWPDKEDPVTKEDLAHYFEAVGIG